MKFAYVSCVRLPEPDFDEQPLISALVELGHDARVVGWDDPSVDWSSFDVALIRAPWNYAWHFDAFRDWIAHASAQTRFINPPETLAWNLHKGYLSQLRASGIAIVPTVFFERGASASVASVCEHHGWSRIVIKPTISAGSFGTRAFTLDTLAEAQSFFDEMIAQREMMIQRYIPSVDTVGETAIVVIDGIITHAVEKRPRFHDQTEQVFLRDSISEEMRDIAGRVMAAACKDHLYARVDVIPDDDGSLLLAELEMLEPSLFFPHFPDAVGVFVRGLERMMSEVSH